MKNRESNFFAKIEIMRVKNINFLEHDSKIVVMLLLVSA